VSESSGTGKVSVATDGVSLNDGAFKVA